MLRKFFLHPMRLLGVAGLLVLAAMGVENAGRWLLALSLWLPEQQWLAGLPVLEQQHHVLALGLLYLALILMFIGMIVGYAQWLIQGAKWMASRWIKLRSGKRGTHEK
ncbi:hypothetical protein [Cedecea sp.]|jgi:hypothetical protein|uniref:hypothetical protein n=1 Tax=Cedecea sp. TaxID=1970739 RepID=UPI002F426EF6